LNKKNGESISLLIGYFGIHKNTSMTYAFHLMCSINGLQSSRTFQRLREEYSIASSKHLSGRKNTPEQSLKHTDSIRAYYKRIGAKGKPKPKGVWSDESRKAQSDRMMKEHHRAKTIVIDGNTFHSSREAARQYNVSHRTIGRWVKKGIASYETGKD
jgi:hypothetical protein